MDERLENDVESIAISQDTVMSEIESVLKFQLALTQDFGGNRNLLIPLSREFVNGTWGAGAFQVRSGYSIVIICPERHSVYKHVLLPKEKDVLASFVHLPLNTSQSCVPKAVESFSEKLFFK